jgi:very-short-patch-repair endonuclease
MLREFGYKTVRIWNNDVLGNIEGVLEMLTVELENAPHPVPLPASGEREPG